MMTSSNGNIFRVTGHLCGEFTGHRWISLTKASDAELWYFLWSAPWINGWVNNSEAGDLIRHRADYDVIVMMAPYEYKFVSVTLKKTWHSYRYVDRFIWVTCQLTINEIKQIYSMLYYMCNTHSNVTVMCSWKCLLSNHIFRMSYITCIS